MKKCNRCKVNKDDEGFKTSNSKICLNCAEVNKKAYNLKKEGKLPKYAQIHKSLNEAFNRGNFICKICNKEKELSNFGKHTNNNKYNLSRICKDCSTDLNKVSKLSSIYNLSKSQFLDKLNEQDYKCKICESSIKYNSKYNDKYSSACVDHDHQTGKIRGLLCNSCNRALGLLKDSSIILHNAYKYLVQYKSDKLLENP